MIFWRNKMKIEKIFRIPGQWTISSYYTLMPLAPDNSGRLTLAACDLKTQVCSVFILDEDGKILDNFGHRKAESMFYHTGSWESWSPDCRYIYYQSGTLTKPSVSRYDIEKKSVITLDGVDLEGAPPSGEPILGGLPGMLYAAGYGYNVYNPSLCPISFEERDRHGIFQFGFDGKEPQLEYSINDILSFHPMKDDLLSLDRELAEKYNRVCGLSLMAYCVRFSPNGEHFLLYFGNHCVVPDRNEPRISHIFYGKRGSKELHFAIDVSGRGCHWSIQDNGSLMGFYRADGDDRQHIYIFDPKDKKLSRIASPEFGGGHPSLSPVRPDICVNDENHPQIVRLWDKKSNSAVASIELPCRVPGFVPQGTVRDHNRCCHHPRFTPDGRYILSNFFDEDNLCCIAKIKVPEELTK